MRKKICVFLVLLCSLFVMVGCSDAYSKSSSQQTEQIDNGDITYTENLDDEMTEIEDISVEENSGEYKFQEYTFDLSAIPQYENKPYYILNNNIPDYYGVDVNKVEFERYSDFDSLGRCGHAFANIGIDMMPTEERGSIGQVKPSGWHTVKYNELIDGNYLYNRCHLIGYQLAGENANELNLITGTRYLNVQGMLPFEDKVADYVKNTGNHVLYRVTPVFDGNNLVASGVIMEAFSVEDQGRGICFNVYCYNVQPGIEIDYLTGDSWISEGNMPDETEQATHEDSSETDVTTDENETESQTYILNTNTKKFHYPYCDSVNEMKDKNKKEVFETRENIIEQGYQPCKRCNP